MPSPIEDEEKTKVCKKLFGCTNHHQLLNEYVLHNLFCFLSNIINCQEQLKTIQLRRKMVSQRAINDIMQTPKKERHFSFFSVCYIVFNCSWQLIMFDKKQKKLCKTYSFSNWWWFIWPKSFLHSKNCFLFILYEWWRIYQLFACTGLLRNKKLVQ